MNPSVLKRIANALFWITVFATSICAVHAYEEYDVWSHIYSNDLSAQQSHDADWLKYLSEDRAKVLVNQCIFIGLGLASVAGAAVRISPSERHFPPGVNLLLRVALAVCLVFSPFVLIPLCTAIVRSVAQLL